MNIKQQFPDEQTLQNYISEHIDEYKGIISSAVGHLEAEYLKKTKSSKWGIVLIISGFIILQMTGVSATLSGWLAFGTLLLSFYVIRAGVLKIISAQQAIETFNNLFNQVLYPVVFKIFALQANLVDKTFEKKISDSELVATGRLKTLMKWLTSFKRKEFVEDEKIITLLDHSELITEPRNQLKIDNVIQADLAGKTLVVAELDVKHVTGSGKNRSVKQIFTGYFVAFDTNYNVSSKTFVSTENDNSGFGNQTFFNSLADNGVKETKLEWNDFENLLRVATDNPIDARYILTTDFMNDLYNWWQGKKVEIRISFVGGRMYLLFPDDRIRFDGTVKQINIEELKKYMESICLPLLHVLHLVHDIEQ